MSYAQARLQLCLCRNASPPISRHAESIDDEDEVMALLAKELVTLIEPMGGATYAALLLVRTLAGMCLHHALTQAFLFPFPACI